MILEQREASPKEAQELERRSTVDLTMNIYGSVREERLSEDVERVGRVTLKGKCVPSAYCPAPGAERENATRVELAGCVSQKLVAGDRI